MQPKLAKPPEPTASLPAVPKPRAIATAGLFTTDGNEYDLFRPATAVTLPAATYILRAANMRGFYLARVEDLPVPERIYGPRNETRIMRAYAERANQGISTGVWLDGEKGAGKTMFASVLSQEMRKLGFPTILMQTPYTGSELNSVIEHIGQACFLFDEFEKVYEEEEKQNALLTIFAGSVVAKNLYIVTTNLYSKVSYAMRNRPTRMRYFIEYRGVSEEIVKEFIEHRMVDRTKHADMIRALKHVPNCNFDIMQCAVEEHNHFGGSVEDLLAIMNISRRIESKWKVTFNGTISHDLSKGQPMKGTGDWRGDVEAKIAECERDDAHEGVRLNFEIDVPTKEAKKAEANSPVELELATPAGEPGKPGMQKYRFTWHVYFGGESKVTYEPDGSISVTTAPGSSDGVGVLNFRQSAGFNSWRQRF
ncbi:MAG: ATPase family associated with various cellular activities (AAA) [Firmicutes bacterium ADurb.Bin506]|nr:MAG: ATPase family associated with various cellular activities (AAA) [Firmicutes bacterium ADurb.Bin506]